MGGLKTIALFMTTLALATPAFADDDSARMRELLASGVIKPVEPMIDALGIRPAPRILEIEFEHHHGAYRYEVELLDKEGRVHEIRFDAASGEILQREIE